MEEYNEDEYFDDKHTHNPGYYSMDKHHNVENEKESQDTENEIYKSNLNNHEHHNNDENTDFNFTDFTNDLINSDEIKNQDSINDDSDFINDLSNESNNISLNEEFINDLSNNAGDVKDKTTAKDIDLRIIVNNTENADLLNKACENIDLDQYNITISAIIQTFNLNIAKSTTLGSDIIFIANEGGERGKLLYEELYNNLKTENNYIEFLQVPLNEDKDLVIEELELSIRKLIVNVGLSSIFNITNFNHLKSEIQTIQDKYNDLESEKEELESLNYNLKEEISNLQSRNEELTINIKDLQKTNDTLKSEFADFKTRYSNIHTKKILEIFSLHKLWYDTFGESLENEENIIIATNKFKPDDIIIGQGLIGANSIDEAIDWLKVVRTALIFVEYNKDELKSEIKPSKKNYYDDNQDSNDESDIGETFSNFMF